MEFSSSHSFPFPPFLPPSWKSSALQLHGCPLKLRENVLGLQTQSQRHRLHAGISQRSHIFSVGLCNSSRLSQHATIPNCALWCQWPILQWKQGGRSHWHFWEVSTGPTSCFPSGLLGMSTRRGGLFCFRCFLHSPTEQSHLHPKLRGRAQFYVESLDQFTAEQNFSLTVKKILGDNKD